MESQDRRKNNQSGNGIHVCNKCGWLYPNPHPSAKQRRSHKRVCGAAVKSGNSGDHLTHLDDSDNGNKTLPYETYEKVEEMAVGRSISGFGSGSNRSNRSEDDVFSDAVTDFSDGVLDSEEARELAKNRVFSEQKGIVGGSDIRNIDVPSQYHLSCSKLDSTSNSGSSVREAEAIHKQSDLLDQKRDYYPIDEQINSFEDSSQEVEFAGHREDDKLTKEIFSSMSTVEPCESSDNISRDSTSEALYQESNFAEEVAVEKETGKTDLHAADEGKITTVEHYPLFSAEEISVAKKTEKTDINATDEAKMITDEQSACVNIGINAHSIFNESENYSHSVSSVKLVDDEYLHNHKDAEVFYVDNFKEAEEAFSLTNGTSSMSDICETMEQNLLREEGNEENHRTIVTEKLSEFTPSVPECENPMDGHFHVPQDCGEAVKDTGSPSELNVGDEVDVSKKTHDLENCVNKALDSADTSLTEKFRVHDARLENIGDGINVNEKTHDLENYVHKTSDSADVNLAENVKENDARLEKIKVSGVELENFGDRVSNEDSFGELDLGHISENDDVNGLNVGAQGDVTLSVEDSKEITSTLTDTQTDSISQADSLEANWGSISDAPATTGTGSQPSQDSLKPEKAVLPNNGSPVIIQPPQSSISPIEQKVADKADQNTSSHNPEELTGKKRSEEIIAKVTNWSAGKQHMALKSYLGESSPGAKEDSPRMSQEIMDAVMAAKERVDNEVNAELSKEWSSPARFESNIKRDKSKVKRPYWAPFVCCSSVETS